MNAHEPTYPSATVDGSKFCGVCANMMSNNNDMSICFCRAGEFCSQYNWPEFSKKDDKWWYSYGGSRYDPCIGNGILIIEWTFCEGQDE